jgi:hypothetical protein
MNELAFFSGSSTKPSKVFIFKIWGCGSSLASVGVKWGAFHVEKALSIIGTE